MTPVVMGVDPGGHSTGVIFRAGDELLTWSTGVREKDEPIGDYLVGVLAMLDGCRHQVERTHPLGLSVTLAVESVVPPKAYNQGRRQMLNPASLIDVATVAGAIAAWGALTPEIAAVVWVAPNHNGQGPLDAYPQMLRPTRGHGAGADNLRHCRSGWDVAGAVTLQGALR